MKQSIIPGISLRDTETLTMRPAVGDGWLFTFNVRTKYLGVLTVLHYMSGYEPAASKYPEEMLGYMMRSMRRRIEKEILRRVLG